MADLYSQIDFDVEELDEYTRELLQIAERDAPKEIDKFLKREANKLKSLTKKEAKLSGINLSRRRDDKKKPITYLESIKSGRAYDFVGGRCIRVYSSAPHAHFLEHGKRNFSHGIDTGTKSRAFAPFKKAKDKFDSTFISDCSKLVDDLLEKGVIS